MEIRKFLLEYAPDFCWCSSQDLLIMAEQIDEDVSVESFKKILSVLYRGGAFISKPAPKQRGTPFLYLRVK